MKHVEPNIEPNPKCVTPNGLRSKNTNILDKKSLSSVN